MSDGSQRSWLIQQCKDLRRHVDVRGLAPSEADLEKTRLEEDADEREWIKAYGTLRAWRYTDHLYSAKLEAEDKVRAALRDEPEKVPITDGRVLTVYPKSFGCLLWFRERDWTLAYLQSWLSDLKVAIAEGVLPSGIRDPDAIRDDVVAEIARQMQKIAGVCCDPKVQLPDPIPAIDDLSPVDFYLLHQAFNEVNASRLGALDRICPPTGGKGDTGWNVFFGTMSQKLAGRSAADLMDNRSLASLIAEARLAVPDMEDELARH